MADLIDPELALAGCKAPCVEKHRLPFLGIHALNSTCLVTLRVDLHILHDPGPLLCDRGEYLAEIHY